MVGRSEPQAGQFLQVVLSLHPHGDAPRCFHPLEQTPHGGHERRIGRFRRIRQERAARCGSVFR